jgi:regulator of sigma E protease
MTAITLIIILGILVFVHELGHFLMAKKWGIRVDEFALGFPPKILSKKVGETEYCLNLIPLGGYVKIYGEDGEPEEKTVFCLPNFF